MKLCRHDVEGSQFTTYMALINFCDVAGSYISGWAMHVLGAPVLGFTCGLGIAAAFAFFYNINRKDKMVSSLIKVPATKL